MPESDLPPIYIKKEHKRIRVDPVLGKFGKHSGTTKTAYLQRLMSPCGLIYMSHFAYACKMRYPLNLVLESWEYLWFY